MKTLVIQAWVGDRPPFIDRCQQSVRDWAAGSGMEYRDVGAEFMAGVPPHYADRVQQRIVPMSNIARLLRIRQFLAAGYDRVIWLDSDIAVFAPQQLRPDPAASYQLTYEVWAALSAAGQPVFRQNVTCSFAMFQLGNPMLEFVLHGLLALAERPNLDLQPGVATRFLTQLAAVVPLLATRSVVQMSPLLLEDIAHGDRRHVSGLMRRIGAPVGAANLGTAFRDGAQGIPDGTAPVPNAVFSSVLEALLSSGGEILNRHADAG